MRIQWFSFVRVTGLILVLLYHFVKTSFPGGFIGVDIFFTFSGYLITALLIDEYASQGSIGFLAFLRRRFYRIVPPLVMMVLVIIPFTFLVRRDFIADLGQQVASALGFTTNVYEMLTGASYEAQFIPHLFVHTWSLAVEVHFYLFWAALLWCFAKQKMRVSEFRGLVYMTALTLFVLGFLGMFIGSFFVDNLSQIYFSSLTHSFAFYLGAVFATKSGIRETTKRFQKNVQLWSYPVLFVGVLGSLVLLVVLSLSLDFNNRLTYLFGFILASLFASTMIYSTRVLSDKTPDLKEPFILTYLSDISYGIYLFHWPLYIIFKQLMNHTLAVFLTIVLSIILATFSYYVLEPYLQGKPSFLFGKPVDIKPYQQWIWTTAGVLATMLLIVANLAPRVGAFEMQMLTGSLKQAQSTVMRTHTLLAGDAKALNDITVIGDSVTLRSSDAFVEIMPEARIDAAVSRNFYDAYDLFSEEVEGKRLSKIVVLAVAVNAPWDYETILQNTIKTLPKGHRLVLVTGYNTSDDRTMAALREYELSLAKTYSYVAVADWYKASQDNPDIWKGTDGVHYSLDNTKGAELYVKTIQKAIASVAKEPAKGE